MIKKNKPGIKFGIHIGATSLLLVFVVITIVSLGALTLVSALSEKALTERAVQKTGAYYDARNQAYEKLSELDGQLSAGYLSGMTREEYYKEFGTETSYRIPLSDTQELLIEVDITYPQNDTFYIIKTFKEVLSEEASEDEEKVMTLF